MTTKEKEENTQNASQNRYIMQQVRQFKKKGRERMKNTILSTPSKNKHDALGRTILVSKDMTKIGTNQVTDEDLLREKNVSSSYSTP